MYDESITRTSNYVIKILVYVGLFLTAWQLGNKQIFENNPGSTLILQLDTLHSHHTLREQLRQANPFHLTYGSPPMVLFLVLTLYLVLRELVVIFRHHALRKPVVEKDEEQLDEGLAPYFVALDPNDYDCFVGQEQHFSEKHYIKTLTQQQFNMMLAAAPNDEEQKLDSKTMQGVGTYRVLDNPLYMQSFSYLAPKIKDGKIMQPSFKHVPI